MVAKRHKFEVHLTDATGKRNKRDLTRMLWEAIEIGTRWDKDIGKIEVRNKESVDTGRANANKRWDVV